MDHRSLFFFIDRAIVDNLIEAMLPCFCILGHDNKLCEFSNIKHRKTGSKEHELISFLEVDEVVILFHGLHHQTKDDHSRRMQDEEDYNITEQI